jgi:hypothetical protein
MAQVSLSKRSKYKHFHSHWQFCCLLYIIKLKLNFEKEIYKRMNLSLNCTLNDAILLAKNKDIFFLKAVSTLALFVIKTLIFLLFVQASLDAELQQAERDHPGVDVNKLFLPLSVPEL